jgi:hypothetical protein
MGPAGSVSIEPLLDRETPPRPVPIVNETILHRAVRCVTITPYAGGDR